MLNIEDFKDEMIKKDGSAFGVEIGTHKVLDCIGYYCEKCLFHGDCKRKRWNWLLSEKKDVLVLPKFEYLILEWLYNECIEYIARDKSGELYAYSSRPYKNDQGWVCDDGCYDLALFSKLFGFIYWEDEVPFSIDYVLNNCEVLEND